MKERILSIIDDFQALETKLADLSAGDSAQMAVLAKERKKKEPLVQTAREWMRLFDDIRSLNDLIQGNDPSMAELALHEKAGLESRFDVVDKKLNEMLNAPDPRADRDSIVEIRAGAGGDEAGLFVADLARMYTRFAQNKGLDVQMFTSNPTGIGGFKEVIFGISGPNAYGLFKYEQGVHRVQRVPATEAQGRIHTSTVTVAVLPEPTEVEIKIDMKDLRIDTYRASGAGGQHVNKTDSAIRITHIPTGVVVQCQEERSQGQNRMRAMALLRAKLQEAAEEKVRKVQGDMRKKQVGTGDRSEKIRTYNFPQDRITDHRINVSVFNIEKVMDGELDEMIAALRAKEEELRRDMPPS